MFKSLELPCMSENSISSETSKEYIAFERNHNEIGQMNESEHPLLKNFTYEAIFVEKAPSNCPLRWLINITLTFAYVNRIWPAILPSLSAIRKVPARMPTQKTVI